MAAPVHQGEHLRCWCLMLCRPIGVPLPFVGDPQSAEKEVADVAVDLFRSPRSKGGFGEVADWADFPDSSVRLSLNPRAGFPRYLAAIRVHMSLTEDAMSIWAPSHNQNAVG